MNKLINIKFLPYLVILIIPSYILGIALTEMLLLILIFLFFFLNKETGYLKDSKILFLISFSLLASLSGLLNLNYTDLKIASIFHFRYVLIAVVISFFLNRLFKERKIVNNNHNKKFFNIFFSIIFFIIFDSLIQFFFGTNLFGQEIHKYRVSSIFGEELILGSFLLQTLPLTFFLFSIFKIEIKRKQINLVIFYSLYLITIYIASGRTPFFLTILFAITMVLFDNNFRKIIIKSLSILIIFIICEAHFEFGKSRLFHKVFVITFIQVTDYNYHPGNKLNESDSRKKEINLEKKILTSKLTFKNKVKEFFESLVVFSNDHQNHYVLAMKLFKEKPILGHGPKGFRNYCRSVNYDSPTGICSTHPHNYFFQILSELGLLGLSFFLFGLFFIIVKFIKSKYYRTENLIISSFRIISLGLLVLLFPLVPTGNFFNNWISIINYYYIGIYIYLYNQMHIQK